TYKEQRKCHRSRTHLKLSIFNLPASGELQTHGFAWYTRMYNFLVASERRKSAESLSREWHPTASSLVPCRRHESHPLGSFADLGLPHRVQLAFLGDLDHPQCAVADVAYEYPRRTRPRNALHAAWFRCLQ